VSDVPPAEVYRKARRHLSRRDPVLKELIGLVGDCTLQPGGEPFVTLVRAVVSQLISTAAARTVYARLEQAAGPAGVTPEALLALGEDRVKAQGLSRTKALAILDLASRAQQGVLPLAGLAQMPEEEVVASLTAVRGIGVWTAEMFLIFCLGRPDVLPVGDFGLRAAVQERFKLPGQPGPAALRAMAEPWRPYRSVATWYFWRSRGFVPQS
jgi:DNA-3-methyladenine glycosylase II